ncbi:MAG: acetylornithine transaminase [Gammaproteobacteria bacterium RIFCSPLOWO2_02_FULL_57_10]|nr:MAG: acetylornithine transaminase [Gammaproteobacteria bacterium RIFCSPLOWO2_02_FULL_57_10]
MTSALMSNYGNPELEFDHGKGCFLYTATGERYLDFTMGIAVNCLGHCHPHLVAALQQQAEKIWHSSNLFRIPQTERLAARLVELTFADRVFFSNSGTEAVEAGFKMMRRYHYSRGDTDRVRIIALTQSFHGRTLAPIAASANPLHCEGFLTGDPGFDQVQWGDIDALRAAITNKTAGVILEPIQGEGGIRVTPFDYLRKVRELCDEKGILLMFDEVQSGVGRSGHLYAYQASGVTPDLLASAKGLGGGFPIGACLSTERVAAPMVAGTHGSTFGGNPLATAVGNAVLDVIMAPGFLAESMERAAYLRAGLEKIIADFPLVVAEQTGLGFMVGLKCVIPNTDVIAALKEARMLVVKAGANTIRLLPPLNITTTEIDLAVETMRGVCARLTQSA